MSFFHHIRLCIILIRATKKKAVVSRNKRLFAVVSGLEARTTNGQHIDYLSTVAFNIAY